MSSPLCAKIDRLLDCDASELSDASRKMLTEIRDRSIAETNEPLLSDRVRAAVEAARAEEARGEVEL